MRDNVLIVNGGNSPGVDMAILANCDHMIITIGTFGWWAAYIGAHSRRGHVVYYSSEFKMQHPTNKGNVIHNDYYLPNWKDFAQISTEHSNIIYVSNPSIFNINKQRNEVFLTNSTPTKCSDGSPVVRTWVPQDKEERNKPFHTHNSLCASHFTSNALITVRHFATVCHPFSGHRRNRPPRWAVEKWVEHYLSHGFSHVYWYVHDDRVAIPNIKNITWFVLPWLKNTKMHFGGQLTAIQHCLYWNKQQKTTWTLFADADEYMVATAKYKDPSIDLVHLSTKTTATNTFAAVDFGEYRIKDFMEKLMGSNNDQTVTRIIFDANNTSRGKLLRHMGRRKTLANANRVIGCNIHYCTPTNKSSFILHHDPRDFALLHIRSMFRYNSIDCNLNSN